MSEETAPLASRLFTPVAVAAMVIVGVASFLAFFALSAFAPELRSGRDGGGHALSYSANGFAAIQTLLRAEGRNAYVSRKPITNLPERGLLIYTPDVNESAIKMRFPQEGATLIVLPNWMVLPRGDRPGWVYKLSIAPDGAVANRVSIGGRSKSKIVRRPGRTRPVLRWAANGARWPHVAPPVELLQTVEGPDLRPVLVDERGRAVLARVDGQRVYVLADPDLLNNQGLKELAAVRNAEALLSLVSEGGGAYAFDVSLHGLGGERNLLKLALSPPFLPATICVVAAALLMGLAAAARFGPARRAERAFALGPEALAENSAGLIRLARREHKMAPRYAALIRQTVAQAIGAPRGLEGDQLTAFLDRLPKRSAESFGALLAEAEQAANVGDLMRSARKLYDWKREMMRVGR